MFWVTVYQGKSAYSWNTTARSQPGSVTVLPPTQSSPRVGISKPASMLSSVVLPQPDGPTIEKNSFWLTSKLTSCSASSGSPRVGTWTLLTLTALTWKPRLIWSRAPSESLSLVPWHHEQRELAHRIVEQQAQDPDQHHA